MRLEPLGAYHAPALLWQYRDPQIAAWTGTEPLSDLDEVHRWLAREAEHGGRSNYAVMHADEGLIGVMCFARVDAAAFIHYWIGCDHQGKGHAVPAVSLAYEQAGSEGLVSLFTTCHRENVRSLRVLARTGFVPLDMPPLAGPDADMLFFERPLREHAPEPASRLAALLEALGWPLRIAEGSPPHTR
jgi:RimJ/RimL family protein N-acetyltransferase